MKKYTYILVACLLLGGLFFALHRSYSPTHNIQKTPHPDTHKTYTSDSWKTEIPSTCRSFFDGCNNCNKGAGDTQNAACTRMACEKYERPKCLDTPANPPKEIDTNTVYDMNSWKTEISPTCTSFFDGCNNCNKAKNSLIAACTMMACEKYEQPKCLDDK